MGMRCEENYVGRRTIEMEVQRTPKRGRPKQRCLDDIKKKVLSGEEVYDRATLMRISSNIDPT